MLARLARRPLPATVEERRFPAMSWEAYQNLFTVNGVQYVTGSGQYQPRSVEYLLNACGPAFAVLDRRISILGEARPAFQRFRSGRPEGIYSTPELDILNHPWPGGTWRHLVSIMESDVAAYGNSYWIRQGSRLSRIEPDWVTVVTGEVTYNGERVGYDLLGYVVASPGSKGTVLEPVEVAHYRPSPSRDIWRGDSWLAAVASDASSDVEMTTYKGNYLRNGAMPSLAVVYEPTLDMAQLEQFVGRFAEKFTGSLNAGKVMHFLGGRDVKTVGATLDQLAFKAVQGAGETRIASAAGVPAVVAGFSEGMQGSSLNAGNYQATRRLFGDAKVRPLLGSIADALGTLVRVPSDSRLWYDDSQVSFFQEDVLDESQIRQQAALTIRQLVDAGYEPDAAVEFANTGNYAALAGRHTGLYSVQLQPPGTQTPQGDPPTPQP